MPKEEARERSSSLADGGTVTAALAYELDTAAELELVVLLVVLDLRGTGDCPCHHAIQIQTWECA